MIDLFLRLADVYQAFTNSKKFYKMFYRHYTTFRAPALQMGKLRVSHLPKIIWQVKGSARIQTELSPKSHVLNRNPLGPDNAEPRTLDPAS